MEEKKYTITHDIIIAFRNGDDDAFNKIYNHYFRQVYFFAITHINDAELAKDIAQNTMIIVYKSVGSLQHIEAFHVWIMKIAYNECKAVFRKNKNKQPVELPDYADIETIADSQPSTLEHIEDVILYETVYKGIQEMSGKLKDVAILRYLDGLSEEEISSVLRIPKGTVKSRNHRIKGILQGVLKQNEITPKTYKASYSVAIPTIITASLTYVSMQQQINVPNVQEVINAAPVVGATLVSGGITFISKKLIAGVIATTSIVLASGYVVMQKPASTSGIGLMVENKIPPKPLEMIEEEIKIEKINYNQAYTKEGIQLEVDTTSENYDRILVNDIDSLFISENGTYTIKAIKNNQVVDERQITITNIDKIAPVYVNHTVEDLRYTIYLSDDMSGVDASTIKYYKNGKESTDYQYNSSTNTLVFLFESASDNNFDIYDFAGNHLNIAFVSELR